MSSKLEITLVLSCTSTSQESQRRVVVTPPPETVDELQSFIQEQFYIPKCVQKLKLKDSTLLVGSQKLSDVYIRNEDSIIVSYLATAEVELVTRFCQSLHPVVASFRKLFEEGEHLKGYSSINNIGDSAIEHVGGCLLYTSPSPRDATLSRMPSSA